MTAYPCRWKPCSGDCTFHPVLGRSEIVRSILCWVGRKGRTTTAAVSRKTLNEGNRIYVHSKPPQIVFQVPAEFFIST